MSSNLIGLDLDHIPGVLHLGDPDHHLPDPRGQEYQERWLRPLPGPRPRHHPHHGGAQPTADPSPASVPSTR